MAPALFKQSFEEPLFSIAFNPSASNYVTGLSTGHVAAYTYNNEGTFKEIWSTKRHKRSCRALGYDYSGECMSSIGETALINLTRCIFSRIGLSFEKILY